MWGGYMCLAGNEIINSQRCWQYAHSLGIGSLKQCDHCENLHTAVGDPPYYSPLQDEAPWFEPDDVDTWGFAGVYPLDMTGADDSVRTANVTQMLGDGAAIGPLRHAAREIVFSVLLVGRDACACAAGMSWLRWALTGSHCREDPFCAGDDMVMFSCCPPMDPCQGTGAPDFDSVPNPNYPGNCYTDFLRTFRKVVVTEGPTVSAKHPLSDGEAWEVQFTATCGVPWTYGNEHVVFDGETFGNSVTIDRADEPACPDRGMADILDPNCPRIPLAPTVPHINLSCFELPDQWDRYAFPVDAGKVRRWQDSVPRMEIHTHPGTGDGVRNLRFRWYTDPLNRGNMRNTSDCGFCGEFLVTWIPPDATMVLDGMDETIQITLKTDKGATVTKNAKSLVMDTNGGPFDWPLITCNVGYMLTVDVPHGGTRPGWLSVSLHERGV